MWLSLPRRTGSTDLDAASVMASNRQFVTYPHLPGNAREGSRIYGKILTSGEQ